MRFKLLLSLIFIFSANFAHSSQEKEFIMSCTYGVLAGSLVGAASLAFEETPSEKLHRIARGASLGLYAGIILGYYTIYHLPSEIEKDQQRRLDPDSGLDDYGYKEKKFYLYPVLANSFQGIGFKYSF